MCTASRKAIADAVEDRIDADLRLGRHAAVVGELGELVAAHPLREQLRHHMALALYRSGRQAEALRIVDDARRTLRLLNPGRKASTHKIHMSVQLVKPGEVAEARLAAQPHRLEVGR